MSCASDKVSRMPRRISAWSSQRMTLIMASWLSPDRRIVLAAIPEPARWTLVGLQGHRQDQRRAGRTAAQIDPPAHRASTLMQPADAEAARLGQVLGGKAAAIVAHLQRQHTPRKREVDVHARGLRVLADIG